MPSKPKPAESRTDGESGNPYADTFWVRHRVLSENDGEWTPWRKSSDLGLPGFVRSLTRRGEFVGIEIAHQKTEPSA